MPSRLQLANAVRALSMDAVQRARSGHPGAPMGMADIAQVLWCDHLRHNPSDPTWVNRDRFVLSNGHGSMLIYSLLHLTGYDLSIDQLKNFRQLHSKTPGHPEFGYTPGVETTTGPLGQGLANAVGMAIAEKVLASQFNRTANGQSLDIVDHHTYVFVGDGCLMEGISHECASLAGTLGLGKLICVYDDNGISIDGPVEGWFTDDTPARFEAYGWQVIRDVDGHDAQQVHQALELAQSDPGRPSLLCCKTVIGFGSPAKSGKAAAHGSPLGEDEVAATRQALQWNYPPFEIPDEIYRDWNCKAQGQQRQSEWQKLFEVYQVAYPELAAQFSRRMAGILPEDWDERMNAFIRDTQQQAATMPSRKASQQSIAMIAAILPELIGGSADLTGSNLTDWPDSKPLKRTDFAGNYIFFGVREFGMTAIMSGVALHGGLLPFSGTFLMFMEYARNAVRMAALMGQKSIFVYTHDSIGQGEDGPTHQPIEQLTNLRSTPGLSVWRPADSTEAAVAWKLAIERQGPTAIVLSRQDLPHQQRTPQQTDAIAKGAYTLIDCIDEPVVIVISTGSEVAIAAQAVRRLHQLGHAVRLVSMVSADVFEHQDKVYQESVLPDTVSRRLAVEAAHPDYWYKWVGKGRILGISRFGESAPGATLMEVFGFTVQRVMDEVIALLES